MAYNEFIDYKSGKLMKGIHYFKNLADELHLYVYHPESKLDGDTGILGRKHIFADKLIPIGKEADKLEERMNGLEANLNVYDNPEQIIAFFSKKWKDVKHSGISYRQFYDRKKLIKDGKIPKLSSKVLKKVLNCS
jgi:hypothetical protein